MQENTKSIGWHVHDFFWKNMAAAKRYFDENILEVLRIR